MRDPLVLFLLCLVKYAVAFWRLPCNGLLTAERLDPIVSPGAISGHVHAIAGGSGLAPTVTYDALRASQCSSCYVQEDMSLYWTPNLWFQWQNGSFTQVPQVGGLLVYYLQRGDPPLLAFPDGFRMLAGNTWLRSYDSSSLEQQAINFVCLDYSRGNGVPATQYLPTQGCSDGLRAQVFFPSCWNNQSLTGTAGKGHMAYPSQMNNGVCPDGFPTRLISLFYEVTFSTWNFEPYRSQAMNSSQPFVFSNGDPTGYGFHGDFVNGWDNAVLQTAVNNCTNDSGVIEQCGAFTFNNPDASCHVTPAYNEVTTGTLSTLPGCNPVTSGPENATPCSSGSTPSALSPVVYETKEPPTGAVDPNAASTAMSGSGYSYVGCYPDSGNPRLLATSLTSQATTTNGLTPSTCLAACKSNGYTYCGLEYGQECWAANALSNTTERAAQDGSCGMTCTGDSEYICGDASLLSLYKYNSTAPVVSACTASNTTTLEDGYAYLGCLIDSGPRTLATSLTSQVSGAMTVEGCLKVCETNKYRYCGLEYSQECWAANYLSNTSAALVGDGQCSMACKGNATEWCGAGNRLSTYEIPNWQSPISTNPGVNSYTFLGCYTDSGTRTLPNGVNGGSVAICTQNCAAQNYTYAGVEYSSQCFCGNSIYSGATIANPSSDPLQAGCNMACSSNSTEACGGPSLIDIYQLQPGSAAATVQNNAAKPKTTTAKTAAISATKTKSTKTSTTTAKTSTKTANGRRQAILLG